MSRQCGKRTVVWPIPKWTPTVALAPALIISLCCVPTPAHARGDEGHEAVALIANITDAQRAQWSSGTASDWATESFDIAKAHAYGLLPAPTSPNHYTLPASYVTEATTVVAEQLSKAGVRLAFVLNNALQ
jgi:S1/P1 Nuclease